MTPAAAALEDLPEAGPQPGTGSDAGEREAPVRLLLPAHPALDVLAQVLTDGIKWAFRTGYPSFEIHEQPLDALDGRWEVRPSTATGMVHIRVYGAHYVAGVMFTPTDEPGPAAR